jgi:hypothetical protein
MNDGTEEEDVFLLPESQNFVHGTAEHFTEKMRFNGLRWRYELRKRVRNGPTLREFLQWVNNRPSPMDEPTRPLGQILYDIKTSRARQTGSSTWVMGIYKCPAPRSSDTSTPQHS